MSEKTEKIVRNIAELFLDPDDVYKEYIGDYPFRRISYENGDGTFTENTDLWVMNWDCIRDEKILEAIPDEGMTKDDVFKLIKQLEEKAKEEISKNILLGSVTLTDDRYSNYVAERLPERLIEDSHLFKISKRSSIKARAKADNELKKAIEDCLGFYREFILPDTDIRTDSGRFVALDKRTKTHFIKFCIGRNAGYGRDMLANVYSELVKG